MDELYKKNAQVFKALSDPNRLMIIDMLSCGELCACVILRKFNITQPTLSHHMKSLCGCGLVKARKDGRWKYYSLNDETIRTIQSFSIGVKSDSEKENCICNDESCEAAR